MKKEMEEIPDELNPDFNAEYDCFRTADQDSQRGD